MANRIESNALARAYKTIRQDGDGDKKITLGAKRGTLIRVMNEVRKQSNQAIPKDISTIASN